MSVQHVVPVQDLIEHLTPDDCFYECPCGPDVEAMDGGFVVTHHSLDGRESQECGLYSVVGERSPTWRGEFVSVTKVSWWRRYQVWRHVPVDDDPMGKPVVFPISRHWFRRIAILKAHVFAERGSN